MTNARLSLFRFQVEGLQLAFVFKCFNISVGLVLSRRREKDQPRLCA